MDNWLLIAVLAIFVVCVVIGYMRGFLKLGLSLLSTILTLVIVSVLTPYISNALVKYTPVDEMLEKRCIQAFIPNISQEEFHSLDLKGTPLEEIGKNVLDSINQKKWELLGITEEDFLSVLGEIPKDRQIQIIENTAMPQFIKDLLIENNNKAIYEELGVTDFPHYVASYLSRMVLNLLSFLITSLIAVIIVKALMVAVHILGDLPVLGTLDHVAGGVLGFVLALLVIWIGMLVLTVAYTTKAGTLCFELIGKSVFLSSLYAHNPLLIALLSFS